MPPPPRPAARVFRRFTARFASSSESESALTGVSAEVFTGGLNAMTFFFFPVFFAVGFGRPAMTPREDSASRGGGRMD